MNEWRHLIKKCIAKINKLRAIATRSDKTDTSHAANSHLAAMLIAAR